MKTTTITKEFAAETGNNTTKAQHQTENIKIVNAYMELEDSMYTALETYSNVHRGSGHFSKVSTHLYDKSREIVLDFMGLNRRSYMLVFCTARRAPTLMKSLKQGSYKTLRSNDFGLQLGVTAVAIRKNAMPAGSPIETGGGTTKLYGEDWAMWANAPDRFEAGTPAIINIIAFAKALLMMKKWGKDIFRQIYFEEMDAEKILYDDELKPYNGIGLLHELRKKLIGCNVLVPTTKGLQAFINFDNSASTPTFTPVWDAFRQTVRQPENTRKAIIDKVRQISAEKLGAPLSDYDILFTSNATESINLAAQSLSNETNAGIQPVILTTILEHSSNDLPWRTVAGHKLIRLPVSNDGLFDLSELENMLRSYNSEFQHGSERIKLLAVSGASNVLGTCNKLPAIGELAQRYGAHLIVDAAQLVAHRKIDMQASGIDYLAFSAHKVYAPFGTGVLIARKGLLHFGDEELKLINASAEENPGGIAALGKALLLLNRIGYDHIEEHEKKMTSRAMLEMAGIPGLKLHGSLPYRSNFPAHKIGVIGFDLKDKMSSKVAGKLARRGGIGVRYGCLCAHLIIKQLAGFTPFQEKMQRFVLKVVPILNLQGITRLSFGIQNTEKEVDTLITELKIIAGVSGNEASGTFAVRTKDEISAVPEKIVKQQIIEFVKEREHLVFG
ncbi:MAG: aminotransferase class V-fold PLP-dependent enzyme [Bacteroidales bacterium]|nr:aminotransferase class V-fold PLP-dependent enzyme [Bacteroidales bacterium]